MLQWNAEYLDLMKRMLTRYQFEPSPQYVRIREGSTKRSAARILDTVARRIGLALVEVLPNTDWKLRELGQDWPQEAETMIGLARLNQLEDAIHEILINDVEGDFVEAGIWRGGATIFMAACLSTHKITDRRIFAADSFQGLPRPSEEFPIDSGDTHHEVEFLRVSKAQVLQNFSRYGVPIDQVVFVEGWFEDTLEHIPTMSIALLRLDGDMYSSTIQTLNALYDRMSPGGIVIVDDYSLIGAHTAVHDFLKSRDMRVEIREIDGSGAYWRVPHI